MTTTTPTTRASSSSSFIHPSVQSPIDPSIHRVSLPVRRVRDSSVGTPYPFLRVTHRGNLARRVKKIRKPRYNLEGDPRFVKNEISLRRIVVFPSSFRRLISFQSIDDFTERCARAIGGFQGLNYAIRFDWTARVVDIDIEMNSVGIFRGNRVFFGGSCDLALGLLLIF